MSSHRKRDPAFWDTCGWFLRSPRSTAAILCLPSGSGLAKPERAVRAWRLPCRAADGRFVPPLGNTCRILTPNCKRCQRPTLACASRVPILSMRFQLRAEIDRDQVSLADRRFIGASFPDSQPTARGPNPGALRGEPRQFVFLPGRIWGAREAAGGLRGNRTSRAPL